jgi:hypothetical protein
MSRLTKIQGPLRAQNNLAFLEIFSAAPHSYTKYCKTEFQSAQSESATPISAFQESWKVLVCTCRTRL